jgi:hypothetical protein
MFDVLAVGSVVAIAFCLLLPASIEKKRDSSTDSAASSLIVNISKENDSNSDTESL